MMCSNFYFIGSFLYILPNIHYCSHSSILCVLFFILIRIKSTIKYWYLHRFRESIKAGINGQELRPKAGRIFCNSICPESPFLLVSHSLHFLNCSHLTIDKTAGPDDLKFVFYCLGPQVPPALVTVLLIQFNTMHEQ